MLWHRASTVGLGRNGGPTGRWRLSCLVPSELSGEAELSVARDKFGA